MSKILKSADIEAAFAKAKNEADTAALIAQVIASVILMEQDLAIANDAVITSNNQLVALSKEKLETAVLIETYEEDLAEANETIAELGKRLSLRENNPDAGVLVTVDGKDYQIIGKKFITLKGEMTAKQVAEDEEILKHFISSGSGAIQLLTDVKPSNLD